MLCSLTGSSVHGISQEYWSRLSCSPLGNLFPTQGLNPPRDQIYWTTSPGSSHIVGGFFTAEPPGNPLWYSGALVTRLLRPHGPQAARLLFSRDSPGKNTGVGCHFLLQRILQPRNRTHVSCIAGWFFTYWATREAQ